MWHFQEVEPRLSTLVLPPMSPPEIHQMGVGKLYQDPSKKWYVMRATYQREKKAYDYLIAAGIECYLPRRRTMKIVNGRRIPMMESLIPGLLFVYTTP